MGKSVVRQTDLTGTRGTRIHRIMKPPKPAAIRRARRVAGLTQTQAAELVHTTCRVWQQWEAGDYKMHPAFFELFMIKLNLKRSSGHE